MTTTVSTTTAPSGIRARLVAFFDAMLTGSLAKEW